MVTSAGETSGLGCWIFAGQECGDEPLILEPALGADPETEVVVPALDGETACWEALWRRYDGGFFVDWFLA